MGAPRGGTFARMGSERGQASVEWIVVIAVVAISLGAMARLAPRDEDHALAATLAHSVTCAAHDGCRHARVVGIRSEKRTESRPPHTDAFIAPPLVPGSGATRARPPFNAPSLVRAPAAPRPRHAARRPSGGSPSGWARRAPGPELLAWARRRVDRDVLGPLRPLLRAQLREGAGRAWRSAWFACLVYERVRWAILHPESRSHEYEFPPSEALRILNDCISPLDLVRDWPLLTTR